ncbi:hypothetical protein BKA83DRAFT_4128894 [Pisolithus microcarpus]|nr:hypothetical protein BKA83DRAFT_4128894 [Pisolithus microcarpus]
MPASPSASHSLPLPACLHPALLDHISRPVGLLQYTECSLTLLPSASGPLLDRSPSGFLDPHQISLNLDCNFRIFGPFLGQISVGLPLFWTAIFAFLDLFLDRSLLGCLCFGLQFFFLGELSCTVLSPNTSVSAGTLCVHPIMPTPPTSPQLAHDAARQAERDQRVLGSPPSRRQPHHSVQVPPALICSIVGGV